MLSNLLFRFYPAPCPGGHGPEEGQPGDPDEGHHGSHGPLPEGGDGAGQVNSFLKTITSCHYQGVLLWKP